MIRHAYNLSIAAALVLCGACFFLSYAYGLTAIYRDLGKFPFFLIGVCHVIVWIGIASLLDRSHQRRQ